MTSRRSADQHSSTSGSQTHLELVKVEAMDSDLTGNIDVKEPLDTGKKGYNWDLFLYSVTIF